MRLYVDGNVMGKTTDGRPLPAHATPVVIGAFSKQLQVLDGVLGELAVYGTALTEAQVKAHRAPGAGR